jgi:hypothetical protein
LPAEGAPPRPDDHGFIFYDEGDADAGHEGA